MDEPDYAAVVPRPPQMLPGDLHRGVEPLPEGERPVGQRLLAELGPRDGQVVRHRKLQVRPERLLAEEVHVFLGHRASGRGAVLCVEGFRKQVPGDLVRHVERDAVDVGERVVPRDGRPRLRFLVAVHDHDHGQRDGPDLWKRGESLRHLWWPFFFF